MKTRSLGWSRLYWTFREFFSVSQIPALCKRTNKTSGAVGNEKSRVQYFNSALAHCACECCRVSKYSPGPIGDDEVLVRFVVHPNYVAKDGTIKTSLFSHVEHNGCSVQRESWASHSELRRFLDRLCPESDKKKSWHGVVSARASDIRQAIDQTGLRKFWMYDTGEPDNPAHAEMGRATNGLSEEEIQELRFELCEIFRTDSTFQSPSKYRSGLLTRP